MSHRAWVWLALSLATAAQAPPAHWQQLERPELAQRAALRDRSLNWYGLQFHFTQGELTLAGPVAGAVSTAVFTGSGELTVLPPDAAEAGQMLRFSRHTPLQAAFSAAVFRMSDSAAFVRLLGPGLAWTPGADREAEEALRQRADHAAETHSPEIARLQLALGEPAPRRWLLAGLKLSSGGWLTAEFDPTRAAPLGVYRLEKKSAPEVWTSFRPAAAPPAVPLPHITSYGLRVEVAHKLTLDVGAQLTVRGTAGSAPGLLLRLDPDLHVVAAGRGTWLQPDGAGWVYVALPQPLAAGQTQTVELRYHGDPPLAAGADGGIVTGDWYPTIYGADDPPPARFALQVEAHDRYQVLTGAAGPVVQSGFAAAEGQTITRGLTLASGRQVNLTMLAPKGDKALLLAPLAGARLEDILNFLGARFGPYPYPTAGLWLDGPVGGADPPVAGVIGFSGDDTSLQAAQAAAGQWWGAWTRPASPGDEWLTQGLRLAGGLFYTVERDGPEAALPALRAWRQLLDQQGGRGPISLGAARLGTDEAALLPEVKGAYALYMLRQMMFDEHSPAPDAGFVAMLHDFSRRYGGQAVTTAEFQAVADQHMTPAMALGGAHSLDWFFQPLLAGTALPVLRFQAEAGAAEASGATRLTLTVDNPQGWRGLLPVYVFRDQDHYLRGLMPITGSHDTMAITVPFTPQYVEANHFLDMLVEVKQ